MLSLPKNTYAKNEVFAWPIPNYWDLIALVLVSALILVFGWGASKMMGHYQLGKPIPISLSPMELPYYALRTVLRMFIALFCSLIFTFIIGAWAAKSRHAGRLIIPLLDILQSVPILGFLSVSIVVFIALFRGSLLGPECAAIFAIFTSQVWNMTFSFYQSLITTPTDLQEASAMFHLSAWQRFWRVEVPFAMPGLLWNSMVSMSASWTFLVASEAISVGQYQISLPGIGSYIALAINKKDLTAILYVIIAMIIVIALYDQLLFRPMVAWAEKFKKEHTPNENIPESWLLNLFQRTQSFLFLGSVLATCADSIVNVRWLRKNLKKNFPKPQHHKLRFFLLGLWYATLATIIVLSIILLTHFIFMKISFAEVKQVIFYGGVTAIRVIVLIILCSIVWVPVGIWIGLNPKLSQFIQPIIQFLAAFPANLLFPIVVVIILSYHLNVNIWTSPLIILGSQWYILFNVIAGTIAVPKNLHHVLGTLNVKGWLWWRRLMLPGVFPFYITGAITASGGAWNMSIIAEAVSWGNTHLRATGLGAYIADATSQGDFPRLVLGIVIMSLYVLVINHIIWRPLYRLAEERFQIL